MHTDETLEVFDKATVDIGAAFRRFNNQTCPAFKTRELAREAAARKRRQQKKVVEEDLSTLEVGDSQQPKGFNLRTYKFHAIGDYAATIRRYGTTDSYNTERVSTDAVSSESESELIAGCLLGGARAPPPKKKVYSHQPKGAYKTASQN
jgi:hypothetical protein